MAESQRIKPIGAKRLGRVLIKAFKSAGLEVVEKALWLYYAAERPDMPRWAKTTVYGALAYLILPLDAHPDFIPLTGYTDDLSVLLAALATVVGYVNDDVKALAAQRMQQLKLQDNSAAHN